MTIQFQEQLLKLATHLTDYPRQPDGAVTLTSVEVAGLIELLRMVANELHTPTPVAVAQQTQAALLERLANQQAALQQIEIVLRPLAELHAMTGAVLRPHG